MAARPQNFHHPDFHEHDDGIGVWGHEHPGGDSWHDHREDNTIPKAVPISPEEDKKIEEDIEKAREQEIARKKREELDRQISAAQWTEADLKALMYDIDNQSGYAYLNGGDEKKIDEMKLVAKEAILDKKMGNPLELQADLTILEELETRNDIIMIRGEKKEKKEKMPPQILDALWAMAISNHILAQNFILTTDKNRQPVVSDNESPSTPERQAQALALQTTLRQKTHGDSPITREWQGDMITKPDKTSSRIISKVDTYITTGAFLAMNMELGTHDNKTQEEFGVGGTKDLPNYRNQLIEKMGGKVDEKSIRESDLTAGQKSFLLAWKNDSDDGIFSGIETRQTAGVLNILANPEYKTPEEKTAENSTNFVSKNYGKMIFGVLGIAAFVGGLKMLFGSTSKWYQRILGGFMLLSVGVFGAKTIDGLIDKTGLYAKMSKAANGTPTEGTGVLNTAPKQINENVVIPIKEKWGRVLARTAGSTKGIELLTNPDVGDEVGTKYPVYSMLHALNPGERALTGAYTAPNEIGQPSIATIDGTLTKLDTIHDRPALNTILQDTWRKYRNTPNFNIDTAKTVTLNEMLTEIDKNENWMDDLINIGAAEKSKEALQIIAQHPVEWSQIPAYELRKFFDPFDEKTFNLSPVSPVHAATILKILNTTQVSPGEDAREIIKNYLGTIMSKNEHINTTMTFRESVTKKDEKVS